MNTQNASEGLRPLKATEVEAEVEAVSGAATESIDMGLFGKLEIGGACATWTTAGANGDGVLTTKLKQCPR